MTGDQAASNYMSDFARRKKLENLDVETNKLFWATQRVHEFIMRREISFFLSLAGAREARAADPAAGLCCFVLPKLLLKSVSFFVILCAISILS